MVTAAHAAGLLPSYWMAVYLRVVLAAPVAAGVGAVLWCVVDAAGDRLAAFRYRHGHGHREVRP
ncbi:hypothetical protein BJY24_007831 [Nocardia transvalensis]|uniref:Uncharacterized protein n=1 Tax=Nocardia transvalensis TaxID=37333 RepID=A0A7W9UMT2_9NOCA|nr:hypothetical protein [Nocardia transvalensis]MBB5918919.1 hypothetical protein [Nocardia transvalensis]